MYARLVPLLLLEALLLAACVDPQGRLNEFSARLPDAAQGPEVDAGGFAELPDLTGTFYVTVEPFQSGKYLHLLWTNTMTIDQATQTGTLAFEQTLLSDNGTGAPREPEGPTISKSDIAVARTGEFAVDYDDLVVVAADNPITASDITVDLHFEATIVDQNAFCGTITHGSTSSGADLAGTRFIGRRVAPGTTGAALPAPSSDCAVVQPSGADAGPVDAGSVDATTPDAT
jgi:hypothetical protein